MGRQGFARASQTAKKQAVPSPATASSDVHRNLCISVPLSPLSADVEADHLEILQNHFTECRDGVKSKKSRWKGVWLRVA